MSFHFSIFSLELNSIICNILQMQRIVLIHFTEIINIVSRHVDSVQKKTNLEVFLEWLKVVKISLLHSVVGREELKWSNAVY